MALVKVPHSFSIPQILWRSNRRDVGENVMFESQSLIFWLSNTTFSFNLPFLGLAYRFLMNFLLQKPRHSIQVVDAHGKAQPKKRLVRQRDWKIRCGLKPMKSRYVWGMNIHKSQLCQLWAEHYWTHSWAQKGTLGSEKKTHILGISIFDPHLLIFSEASRSTMNMNSQHSAVAHGYLLQKLRPYTPHVT